METKEQNKLVIDNMNIAHKIFNEYRNKVYIESEDLKQICYLRTNKSS